MKEPQLVFFLLMLSEAWDLPALCRLLVSISLRILAQTPISLGGKTVLVDFMVIEDPLDFNMLLGRDYVYDMQVVVSTLFRVMHFNHGEEIVTIE